MHPALSAFLSRRLVDRSGGHRRRVLALLDETLRVERLPRAELDRVRDRALADLLNHVRERVPRFRAVLADGGPVRPEDAMARLRALPPMRRADIQAVPDDFIAEAAGALVDDFTGGSSGTPLRFKVDAATQQAREASLFWSNSLAGWRYGGRVAMLWGSDRDTLAAQKDWKLELRWMVDNMRWYNAFNMGEDRMAAFHRELTRFRPHLLVAYAGSVFALARYLERNGVRPAYPGLAVMSSAEMLTPPMRSAVERVFGRPVHDRYGNREAGAIAAECDAHRGLHVNEQDFVVEIDNPEPTRTPGPVLITYLRNRAMPLIRYDTGDLGLWLPDEPCPCGRTTRRLAAIVGRQSDLIRTPAGRVVHGEYFTHVLYGAEGVESFQFVQETPMSYRLRVVGNGTAAQENTWREKILHVLDSGSRLEIEYVKELPPLASGKRRFTVSLVERPG